MLPVLNAAEMRAADRHTIDVLGVPDDELMEHAGAAVARVLDEEFGDARPAVLCGRGNNGGDGLVVARRMQSLRPLTLLFGRREDVSGAAAAHLLRLEAAGSRVREVADEAAWSALLPEVLACGVIVDALLGTGLRAAPTGVVGAAIRDLLASSSRPPIVAVDIPSGLSADAGGVEWPALEALVTVAIAAPKYGHVLAPACDRVGRLLVADIGIPREACAARARLFLLEAHDAALAYPERRPGAHKGDFGHVLVLAGSAGKTGAAALAAHAALRAGAGLVTVATPENALPLLVSQARPEVMTEALPDGWSAKGLERALGLAAACDAVVLGPGLGREKGASDFVRGFAADCERPLVVDADGLNALAAAGGVPPRARPTVLTPHPGEMGRLIGANTRQVQARRVESAVELAQRQGVHVVLKGQRTLVAGPGGRVAVNPTGNAGMATAGTGDVLAGILGALLARRASAWEAATAAVYLHGLAGDLCARRLGHEALMAGDVIAALPEALRAVRDGA